MLVGGGSGNYRAECVLRIIKIKSSPDCKCSRCVLAANREK